MRPARGPDTHSRPAAACSRWGLPCWDIEGSVRPLRQEGHNRAMVMGRRRGPIAQSSMPWHNWAGNVTRKPRRVAEPHSTQEVAAEVRRAADDGLPIRMTGRGHSFTPTAATNGVMLRPTGLRAIRSINPAAGTVTVEAGCPLHVLNA